MKRLLSVFVALLLAFEFLPVAGYATEVETILFDDGSYATIEIICSGTRLSGSKTGSKTYTYYNSDSVMQWKVTLTGSFTYNGASSMCTDSDITIDLYNSNCYIVSQVAGKEGNIARGSATIGLRFLGITVEKKSASLTLTCDADGNLS